MNKKLYRLSAYLVINGFKQPLTLSKNSQLNLFFNKTDAEKRVKRTQVMDKIGGRKRKIVNAVLLFEA